MFIYEKIYVGEFNEKLARGLDLNAFEIISTFLKDKDIATLLSRPEADLNMQTYLPIKEKSLAILGQMHTYYETAC